MKHFYKNTKERDEDESLLVDVEKLEPSNSKEDKQKYECEHCDKAFEYRSTLERHTRNFIKELN